LEKQSLVDIKWLIREWDEISEAIHETFGSGSALILRHVGEGIGRGYAENIKGDELSLQNTLKFLHDYFAQRALGKLAFAEIKMEDSSGKVIIQGTSLRNPHSRFILYGIIAGFLEEVTGKKTSIREVKNEFPAVIEAAFYLVEGETLS